MTDELRPLTPEQLEAAKAKYNQHADAGHTLSVTYEPADGYLYFMASCSCGEQFIANSVER